MATDEYLVDIAFFLLSFLLISKTTSLFLFVMICWVQKADSPLCSWQAWQDIPTQQLLISYLGERRGKQYTGLSIGGKTRALMGAPGAPTPHIVDTSQQHRLAVDLLGQVVRRVVSSSDLWWSRVQVPLWPLTGVVRGRRWFNSSVALFQIPKKETLGSTSSLYSYLLL